MNEYRISGDIEPFFFGHANRKLYGCCHLPAQDQANNGVIVLCQAIAQEYIHGHRACYQLAAKLAGQGFAVLRFDYFGCGDSQGDFGDGGLQQWTTDIVTAVDEAQARFGSGEVCLIGYRLGASLAIGAAGRLPDLRTLVLWEPIYNGQKYLAELAMKHSNFCKRFNCPVERSPEDPSLPTEILGFPFTAELIQEMQAIDLSDDDLPPGCRSLTIFNRQKDVFDSVAALGEKEHDHEVKFIADQQLWEEELYKRLIPVKTLDTIVSWVKNATP